MFLDEAKIRKYGKYFKRTERRGEGVKGRLGSEYLAFCVLRLVKIKKPVYDAPA